MESEAPVLPSFWNPDKAAGLVNLARQAGACVRAHRTAATEATQHKSDGSPVTAADRDSERLILAGLQRLTPNIPIVSEEKENPASLTAQGLYWLVDPLDGTRDFVAGGNEFSINIGLINAGEPTLGVIYAPAQDDLFYGDATGAFRQQGATRTQLNIPRAPLTDPPRLITSQREARKLPISAWMEQGRIASWRICSSAYKFGLLAANEYDLFLRTGTTYEWDTAAGDAILRAVGGKTLTPDGKPLSYGKPDFYNGAFLAAVINCPMKDFMNIRTLALLA